MRSLERSRGKDLDQVGPEHMRRESAEFSWDDLKSVPFKGNSKNSFEGTKRSLEDILNDLDNSLPDDETQKEKELEKQKEKINDLFKQMDRIASFGRNARQNPKKVEDAQKEFDKAVAEAYRIKDL